MRVVIKRVVPAPVLGLDFSGLCSGFIADAGTAGDGQLRGLAFHKDPWWKEQLWVSPHYPRAKHTLAKTRGTLSLAKGLLPPETVKSSGG